MDGPIVGYSIKVDRNELARAKRFFARSQLEAQDVVRWVLRMASDCEACLELVEAKAPIEQVQSAFASILADAKQTWQLNGIFRDAIQRTADVCKVPQDFITNVLGEAERISRELAEQQDSEPSRPGGSAQNTGGRNRQREELRE